MTPGDSGERPIVPGRSAESFLIKLVEGHGQFADKKMPTKGPPLTADQIAHTFAIYPSLSGSVTEAARQLMLHEA